MLNLFIVASGKTRMTLVDIIPVALVHVFVYLDSSKQKDIGWAVNSQGCYVCSKLAMEIPVGPHWNRIIVNS